MRKLELDGRDFGEGLVQRRPHTVASESPHLRFMHIDLPIQGSAAPVTLATR